MSTTMPMQIQTQATEELRRTRSLRRHRSQNQKKQVQAQGRSTRITTRKNTRSTRPTWRTNMSTTRLTRLSQLHQCTMDLSPKIRTTGEVETGLFALEEICKPASTFARVSLEQRSMELAFSPVEGGVPDCCPQCVSQQHLTHMSVPDCPQYVSHHHPSNKGEMLVKFLSSPDWSLGYRIYVFSQ